MTPIETLAKYGLKTDVKSIKDRLERDTYLAVLMPVIKIPSNEYLCDVGWEKLNIVRTECRSADLSLLCELAKKGERYEKAVKTRRDANTAYVSEGFFCGTEVVNEKTCLLDEIIAESEGEPK